MAEIGLAWVLQKPAVTAPIVGVSKLEHVEAALRASAIRLEDEEIKSLEQHYRPHPVRGF
jgi:aryl-alcohol dehydrogenase-like predicted oxidoreductase